MPPLPPSPGSATVLGQVAPAAATPTLLYTGPAALQVGSSGGATIAGIAFCETNNAAAKVRISIRVNGAADAIAQYVLYDFALAANGAGMWPQQPVFPTIGPGDIVYVQSDTGKVSFTLCGYANL